MTKLLILSILGVIVGAPAIGALDGNPRRGLRRSLLVFAAFAFIYFAALLIVIQRML